MQKSKSSYRPGLFALMRKNYISYLFVLPFMSVFFTFTVLPVAMSLFNSFTRNNILEPSVFVGFANYVRMFTTDTVFQTALQNTIYLALIIGPGGYLLSLGLAWLINSLPKAMRTIFVVIFYAPATAPAVVTVWGILFSGDEHGYINGFLMRWGFIQEPIEFLFNTDYMMMVLIITQLWMSMGIGFLSFVAGLRNIDKQYYEAAAVDGVRNRWQEAWFITLPMMMPQLMFGAIMAITGSFAIGAVTESLFGFPSTDYAVHTMVNHLTDHFFLRYDIGYASAIATVMFFLMIGCNRGVKWLLGRVGK